MRENAILRERANAPPGAGHAVAQHVQLLLLQVLRIGLEQEALVHPSWLRLPADPALAPAVTLCTTTPRAAGG